MDSAEIKFQLLFIESKVAALNAYFVELDNQQMDIKYFKYIQSQQLVSIKHAIEHIEDELKK